MSIRIDHIPGSPKEAGFTHGRLIRDLVEPTFLDAYTSALGEAIGFSRSGLRQQGVTWIEELPEHFATEIDAMAAGAGVPLGSVVDLLFADIARSERSGVPQGPMCSALIARLADNNRWIGRNCDWLTPTLTRGVSAVVHEVPNRIPIMALGICGDIDVDTGLNAEGLWMHLHTAHATDIAPEGVRPISWLFWAREALETCASLDDLEKFINTTPRDRGVMVIASESRTGDAAVFECGRAVSTRHDAHDHVPLCVTNHSLARDTTRPVRTHVNESGTISRRRTLQDHTDRSAPSRGPDDLISSLALQGVEMRTPRWLRTIYSAVVNTQTQSVWFAAGSPDGRPAASQGTWEQVRPRWLSKHVAL